MRACVIAIVTLVTLVATSARADLLFPGESWPTTYWLTFVSDEDGTKIAETYSLYAKRLRVQIRGDVAIARGQESTFVGRVSDKAYAQFHALLPRRESVRLPAHDGANRARVGIVFRVEGQPTWTLYGDMPETPTPLLRDVLALRERLRADAKVAPRLIPPALHDAAVGVVRVVDGDDADEDETIAIEVMFPANAIEPGPRAHERIAVERLELFDANGRVGLVDVPQLDIVPWCGSERAVWKGRVRPRSLSRALQPRDPLDGVAAFARAPRQDARTGADLRRPATARGFMRGDANGDGVLDALLFVADAPCELTLRVPRGDGAASCCLPLE